MTPLPIEEYVARWLEALRVTATPSIELLSQGTSHRVWRVRAEANDWAFRLRTKGGAGYVSLHERERHIWQQAAAHGFAPALHHVNNNGALWISDFIPPTDQALNPSALGQLCHRIHQLPAVGWRLDIPQQFDRYAEAAAINHPDRVALSDVNDPQLAVAISALAAGPQVLCHNDLLPENVLGVSSDYRAIDWEYAAMGSPYFDTAATLAALSRAEGEAFLKSAFPAGHDDALLAQGIAVYNTMESAWRAAGGNT